MCLNIEKVLREIEEYCHKMYKLADKKDLTDPEVVNISMQLDRLLNTYYAYRYKATIKRDITTTILSFTAQR